MTRWVRRVDGKGVKKADKPGKNTKERVGGNIKTYLKKRECKSVTRIHLVTRRLVERQLTNGLYSVQNQVSSFGFAWGLSPVLLQLGWRECRSSLLAIKWNAKTNRRSEQNNCWMQRTSRDFPFSNTVSRPVLDHIQSHMQLSHWDQAAGA